MLRYIFLDIHHVYKEFGLLGELLIVVMINIRRRLIIEDQETVHRMWTVLTNLLQFFAATDAYGIMVNLAVFADNENLLGIFGTGID